MSEREDVEALAEVIRTQVLEDIGPRDWQDALFARRILASDWLAAHVEAVRVSERVRLAGEVDALARVEALADEWERAERDGGPRNYAGSLFGTAARDLRAALDPKPGVRLTEEE